MSHPLRASLDEQIMHQAEAELSTNPIFAALTPGEQHSILYTVSGILGHACGLYYEQGHFDTISNSYTPLTTTN